MKALFVPAGPVEVASSRYRLYQYLDVLPRHGIWPVLMAPPNREPRYVYLAKLLTRAVQTDIIYVQKARFPRLLPLLKQINPNIVFDFDDAIFTAPPQASWPDGKLEHNKKACDRMLFHSKAVVAGNEYLARYASAHNPCVFVIATPIDTNKYVPTYRHDESTLTVGWVGNAHNLHYLDLIGDPLKRLCTGATQEVVLKVVSDAPYELSGVRVLNRSWSLEREVADLEDIDIGVMPLTDDEWTRGKCAFKALQFMALGKPVIASPVGANLEVIEHTRNGFLAHTAGDWLHCLAALAEDPELRLQLGLAARKTVERRYSLEKAAQELAQILYQLV